MNKVAVAVVIIILVFFVAIMAMLALFVDNTDITPSTAKNDTLSYADRKNLVYTSAFQETAETKSISFLFSESELNLLLNAYLRENMPSSKGISITYQDNGSIYVRFSFRIGVFNTVLRAYLDCDIQDNHIDISIKDLTIGKAGSSLSKIFTTPRIVNKILAKYHIFASFDDSNMSLHFNDSQLKKTLENSYSGNENANLYSIIINRAFAESDMLDIVWCENGKIGIEGYLSELEYAGQTFGDMPYIIPFPEVKGNLAYLLDNQVIAPKNSELTFKYLIQGYSKLKDEEKTEINKMDFSSIGIANNITYRGVFEGYEQSIAEVMATQLNNISFGSGGIRLSVDENALNAIFIKLPIIGQGSVFYCKSSDNYTISHITLESMFFNVAKDNIEITIIVNINGFRIAINSSFFGYNSTNLSFSADLNNVDIGELVATKDEKQAIMYYLKTSFEQENWITCDTEKQSITFDFEKVIDNSMISGLFSFGFNIKVSAIDGENDVGLIAIDLKASLFS